MVSVQRNTLHIESEQILNGLVFAGKVLQQTGIMDSIWQGIINLQDYEYTPGTNTSGKTTFSNEKPRTITEDELREKAINIVREKIRANLKTDEEKELLANVVKKYTLIKEAKPEITEDELATRMENYIKGYLYHLKESQFGLQSYSESVDADYGYSDNVITDERVTAANKNNDMEAYKAAFHQQAKEYMEYYDDNNDGKIDEDEFIRKEVADLKEMLGEELNTEEGTKIQEEAKIKIALFDMNNDDKLDENEISAYLWSRSKWQGDGDKLTYAEYNDYESAMYGAFLLNTDEIKKAEDCSMILKQHDIDIYELPEDLSALKLSNDELQTVKDGLEYAKIIERKRDLKGMYQDGYNNLYTKLD